MATNTFFDIVSLDGSVTEWIQIERGNGEFTSMPKSVYDEQQKALKDAAN